MMTPTNTFITKKLPKTMNTMKNTIQISLLLTMGCIPALVASHAAFMISDQFLEVERMKKVSMAEAMLSKFFESTGSQLAPQHSQTYCDVSASVKKPSQVVLLNQSR
ncbi:unnamed protein product [Phytophthora lilii]|nr:unnamed protein product [Phytophthora lilii]